MTVTGVRRQHCHRRSDNVVVEALVGSEGVRDAAVARRQRSTIPCQRRHLHLLGRRRRRLAVLSKRSPAVVCKVNQPHYAAHPVPD